MIRTLTLLLSMACPGAASALDLAFPAGSRLVSDRGSTFDSYALPVGVWADGTVPATSLEGRVDRQSWRVDSASITTLQMLEPLRRQLDAAGFELVFECVADACGGFDFRFAIEVIPAPDMFVDIRDYRFLAARMDDSAVSLLVSRSRTAGYVQVIQVGPADRPSLNTVVGSGASAGPTAAAEPAVASGPLAEELLANGSAILSDLEFATGTTDLSDATYASLSDLAAFMGDNANAVVALVGHTDATGDLEVNISVSKRRAQAVRQRLIEAYGVAAARLSAEGMGYLAPVASNLTQAGRERNRRVEVILLSLE